MIDEVSTGSNPQRPAQSRNGWLFCRSTSCGTGQGRGSWVMFLTPRASQSSFFITAITISAMPSVAIAR